VAQLEQQDDGGYWSRWFDVDPVMDWGTGEFEDCSRVHYQQDERRQCDLGCETPLAMRYSMVDPRNPATWSDIGKSTVRRT